MPMTRSRSNHRAHAIAEEADRQLVRPAKRAIKSARRTIKRSVSSTPSWLPWAAAGLGLCALIYGLAQIEAVRDFARSATEPISDLFEGDEFDEEDYAASDSDYGDREAGGL